MGEIYLNLPSPVQGTFPSYFDFDAYLNNNDDFEQKPHDSFTICDEKMTYVDHERRIYDDIKGINSITNTTASCENLYQMSTYEHVQKTEENFMNKESLLTYSQYLWPSILPGNPNEDIEQNDISKKNIDDIVIGEQIINELEQFSPRYYKQDVGNFLSFQSNKKLNRPTKVAKTGNKDQKESNILNEENLDFKIYDTEITNKFDFKDEGRESKEVKDENVKDILKMIDTTQDLDENMYRRVELNKACEPYEHGSLVEPAIDFVPTAFELWEQKYRSLVVEEFPDSGDNLIGEKLMEIWLKVPYEFQAKYHEKSKELKAKAKKFTNFKKQTRKTKEHYNPSKRPRVLKPKALKFSQDKKTNCNHLEESAVIGEENVNFDYRNALKETMTYNSPDKHMKRKLSTKIQTKDITCLYNENEIATGYLQDILLSQQTNEIEIYLDTGIEKSYEYLINSMSYDVAQLDSYLQGNSSIFETCGMLTSTAEVEATIKERTKQRKKQREAQRLRRNELSRLARKRKREIKKNLLNEQNDEIEKTSNTTSEKQRSEIVTRKKCEMRTNILCRNDDTPFISDELGLSRIEETKLKEKDWEKTRLIGVIAVDDLSDILQTKCVNKSPSLKVKDEKIHIDRNNNTAKKKASKTIKRFMLKRKK